MRPERTISVARALRFKEPVRITKSVPEPDLAQFTTLVYSNGQVEGQVNKLKLIKRTMYGRAAFPLLRQRVLHAL